MSLCFKCHKASGCIPSRDGVSKLYCNDCFALYCTKLVRDGLFMHCQVALNEPIAVAVSGGPASMFLLHQLGMLRLQQRHQRKDAANNVATIDELNLLPFHLSEHELIIPPLTTDQENVKSAEMTNSNKRCDEANYWLKIKDQFVKLEQLATLQPATWLNTCEHHLSARKKDKKAKKQEPHRQEQERTIEDEQQESEEEKREYLFHEHEVQVFYYSDFIAPEVLQIIRYYIHHAKLTLTQRECLYYHIHTQTLCRAAHRCVLKWQDKFIKTNTFQCDKETLLQKEQHKSECNARNTCATTCKAPRVHLLLAEHAVRAAIMAMYAIVNGKGGDGVVHSSAFRSLVHNTIVLRPVRMCLPKEIVLYNKIMELECSFTPTLSTLTSLPSMFGVIEKFLLEISIHYRTMIFNVLRMAQKLQVYPQSVYDFLEGQATNSNSNNINDKKRVVLCKAAEENQKKLLSAAATLPECPSWLYSDNFSNNNNTNSNEMKINNCGHCAFCGVTSELSSANTHDEVSTITPALELYKVAVPDNILLTNNQNTDSNSNTEDIVCDTMSSSSPLITLLLCRACRLLLSDINDNKRVVNFTGSTFVTDALYTDKESISTQNVMNELIGVLFNLENGMHGNIRGNNNNTALKRVRGELSALDKAAYLLY